MVDKNFKNARLTYFVLKYLIATAMNPIVLFPSSSGAGATTRATGSLPSTFVGSVKGVLPIGQVLINLVGGKDLSKA